jgi:cyclase
VRFRKHRHAGDVLELAQLYRNEGADELVFYDITASPEGRAADSAWVRRVGQLLDIPFCVAGGIRSVAEAEALLAAGADKISVNSPALEQPALIDELARRFGSQCVVIGIDSQRSAPDQPFCVYQYAGDPKRMRWSGRLTLDWVREVQSRGAGEIVLNAIASDGTRDGYDLEQCTTIRDVCRLPLVASGGAGAISHFIDVLTEPRADGALAASVFHTGFIRIGDLKRQLKAAGVPVRLTSERTAPSVSRLA